MVRLIEQVGYQKAKLSIYSQAFSIAQRKLSLQRVSLKLGCRSW